MLVTTYAYRVSSRRQSTARPITLYS